MAAASSVVVVGAATPASAYQIVASPTITPDKNLVDNDTVDVNITGYAGDAPGTTLYVVECTFDVVISKGDTKYCDQSDPTNPDQSTDVPEHVLKLTTDSSGDASGTFTVHTGSDFLAADKNAACDYAHNQHSCIIVVTDGQTADTTTYASFGYIYFKDTRVSSKTSVSAPKSAKAGAKAAVSAKVKGSGSAKPTGKVTFKDNGKKCGKPVSLKSAKASAKCTVVKGKNAITASYAGDANYQASSGKATIVGKVPTKKKKK